MSKHPGQFRPTPQQELVRQYLEKYPGSPKQAIARALLKENPGVFKDLDAARKSIRYATGSNGAFARKRLLKAQPHAQVDLRDTTSFARLPRGMKDIDNFKPFRLEEGETLVINDVHIPWYDRRALEAAIEYGRRFKIKTVLLNGDIADCYAQSRWETNPQKRDAAKEMKLLGMFFTWVREVFPNAEIVWKYGNHEERHENYLMVRAPELLALPMMDLHELVKMANKKDWGIRVVKDMRPIRAGNLYILHGHEYKFAIQNPVNPARGLYLRSKKSTMCGHFHQESAHTESDISEDITTCWSVACLCDLHPRYMPLNKWCHGVARVTHASSGAFTVENKRIFNGELL